MKNQNRKELLTAYKERQVTGGICAIKNTENGKMVIAAVNDLQGYQNRVDFARTTGGCLDLRLQKDWEKYGADAFTLQILEQLEKGKTQTLQEFSDDIKTLRDMWLEKLNRDMLY